MAQETIEIRGITEVSDLLRKFGSPETRSNLHQRFGIQGLNWVNENFQKQGALTGTKWAPLAKSTLAGRRRGKGRGSSQILIDRGDLRKSFAYKSNATEATVGSPLFYSEFHEEGRKGPWAIRPKKPGGVLAFNGANGKTVFARSVQHPGYAQRRMLPRSTDASWVDKLKDTALKYFAKLMGQNG